MTPDAQRQETVRSLWWAPLIAPLDENAAPDLLNALEDGARLERDPFRAVHHVKLVDLPAFAKEHGYDGQRGIGAQWKTKNTITVEQLEAICSRLAYALRRRVE
jgi:hypothetical protein